MLFYSHGLITFYIQKPFVYPAVRVYQAVYAELASKWGYSREVATVTYMGFPSMVVPLYMA